MIVHVKHIGAINRPIDRLSRWFHIYFLEARNGAVAMEESEDLIEDGDYDLPDKDWVYNDTEDYGEDLVDEQDILGRSAS